MKWPLLTLLLFAPTAAAQTRAVVDSIDGYVRSELARQGGPGMSVAVLRGDSVRSQVMATVAGPSEEPGSAGG
jgi:hypothetical protein